MCQIASQSGIRRKFKGNRRLGMCDLGIEWAWRQLHETITRKDQCTTNEELLRDVFGRFAAEQFSPTDMNPSAPPPESGARVEWWSTFCLIP